MRDRSAANSTDGIDSGASRSRGSIFAFIFVAVVLMLTCALGLRYWHRHQALINFTRLIETSEADGGAEATVHTIEALLHTELPPDLQDLVERELQAARLRYEEETWAAAVELDSRLTVKIADDDESAAVDQRYEDYFNRFPSGKYRDRAVARLESIEMLRDDSAFEIALRCVESRPWDIEAQERELQRYLDRYPQGRHSTRALAILESLPEKVEEKLFDRHETEVRRFFRAERYSDAFDRLDRAMLELKGRTSREKLRALEKEILDKLERVDANACLGLFDERRRSLESRRAACELFLLCYPESESRRAVEQEIQRIEARLRDEGDAPTTSGEPSAQTITPAKREGSSVEVALQRMVKRIESNEAAPDAVVRQLPDFDFRWFDGSVVVSVDWTLTQSAPPAMSLMKSTDGFEAEYKLHYLANIRRKPDAVIPSNVKARVDSDIAAVNQNLKVEVSHEIRGRVQQLPGTGVRFRKRAGQFLVSGFDAGSEAAQLGILVGDRLIAVGESWIERKTQLDQLESMIASSSVDGVTLCFERSSRRFRSTLPLRAYPRIHCEVRQTTRIFPRTAFNQNEFVLEWSSIEIP